MKGPARERAGKLCAAGLHPHSSSSSAAEGCGSCNQERSLAAAVDALLAATTPPGAVPITATLARAAITEAAAKTPPRETIAAYLLARPRALTDGDSNTPMPLQRLIVALRAAGVTGLVDPRCLDCRRPRPLPHPVIDGRVCTACHRQRRPPELCASCNRLAPRASLDANGQPQCSTCSSNDPRRHKPCGRCGTVTKINAVIDGVPFGRCCYASPVHRCTVCGTNRSGRSYRIRQRICVDCASKPHTSCAACGRDAPIPPPDTEARCAHCTRAPPAACRECGQLTIGRDRDGRARCEKCYRRPVRPCGRCGRVRAIVRLATGNDPDLCAICWTGPTVTCEGCGRVRPCRGERRGRMLCNSCGPVAPQRCTHCNRLRRVGAHWPEGPVCGSCYSRALAAKDSCPSCGQTRRLLHYPGFPTPLCRHCAGAAPGHVCAQCGAEDALHNRGVCARCVLHQRLTELLGDKAQRAAAGLDALFDALHAARSAKDMLRWLDDSPAIPILRQIASGQLPRSHQTLDSLPPTTAFLHLEHLLVATDVLPTRDPALARLERWVDEFLTSHPADPALRTFAHWILLRRYRRKSRQQPLDDGVLNSPKRELRAAAAFLDALARDDTTLADCSQTDIDAWLAGDRPDRHNARSFARWAISRKLMPKLDFPTGRSTGPAPAIIDDDRLATARRLLHDNNLDTRDRVAGTLIVLFAQPVNRIARLTINDLDTHNDTVTIRLGTAAIEMPEPLATHLRNLINDRRPPTAATLDNPCLFPSTNPGRPISANALSRRLKRIGVNCADAKRTALLQLCGQLPAALVADLLGISLHTATRWADTAGRPWSIYPNLR